jgi:putative endonuclease
MYYTYVIQSEKDKRFYTGFTRDLQNRLNEHNLGKVASTKNRGPFILVYYKACLNEQDATAREKYLKSGMGKRYLRNRLKRFLSLTG